MTDTRSQIPLGYTAIGGNGRFTQRWAFWFQQFVDNLPPAGAGYVIDGSAGTYGPMTLYQGTDSAKGSSPTNGSIYFALDTGEIYIASGGAWERQSGMYFGDVTKPAHSNELTLATVNSNTGTWGDSSNVPVVTVNEKGLVTSIITVPITTPDPPAAGPPGAVQFNYLGSFAGSPTFIYDPSLDELILNNQNVGGVITFANPLPTFNNLSPLTTVGDILGYDGTNNVRVPVGEDGTILTADSTQPDGLSYLPRGVSETVWNFGDATPKNLYLLEAGKVVYSVSLVILVALDDPLATLSVGDLSDPVSLLDVTDNIPTETGTFTTTPSAKYVSTTQLTLSISPGVSTQGSGIVIIEYQQ